MDDALWAWGGGEVSLTATDNVVSSTPCSGTVRPIAGVTTSVSGWVWEGVVEGSEVSGTGEGSYTSTDTEGNSWSGVWNATWEGTWDCREPTMAGTWQATDNLGGLHLGTWECTMSTVETMDKPS